MNIKPLIKKEFLELIRDYKSLTILALLPLVMMPTLAIFNTYLQTLEMGIIYIDNKDYSEGYIGDVKINSSYIINYIIDKLYEQDPTIVVFTDKKPNTSVDIVLTIPEGFSYNLTSLKDRAIAQVMRVPQSPKADRIANQIYSALWSLSEYISKLKIKEISDLAGIDTDPIAVREPIAIVVASYIAPTGEVISVEQALKITIARLLAFSLIFVATPSITYVVDSILGEKERKTIEILLTTPITRRGLIIAKAFTSSIIGLFAAIVDVVAVFLFLIILSQGYGAPAATIVDPILLLINGLVVYVTILATLSLSMPIIIRSSTMRTAQISSSVITIIASAIFFSVLFVDIIKLPQNIQFALMVIPYTHSVLSIQRFAYGDLIGSFIHILILTMASLILLALASKLLNEEKMLMKPV